MPFFFECEGCGERENFDPSVGGPEQMQCDYCGNPICTACTNDDNGEHKCDSCYFRVDDDYLIDTEDEPNDLS